MKKIIRFLALALICVCCVAAVAGCGGKKNIVASYEVVKPDTSNDYCDINIKVKKNVEYTDLYYMYISDFLYDYYNCELYDVNAILTNEEFIQTNIFLHVDMYTFNHISRQNGDYDFQLMCPKHTNGFVPKEFFIYSSNKITDKSTDLLNYIGYIKITDFSAYRL